MLTHQGTRVVGTQALLLARTYQGHVRAADECRGRVAEGTSWPARLCGRTAVQPTATASALLANSLGLSIPSTLEPAMSRIGAGSLVLVLMRGCR